MKKCLIFTQKNSEFYFKEEYPDLNLKTTSLEVDDVIVEFSSLKDKPVLHSGQNLEFEKYDSVMFRNSFRNNGVEFTMLFGKIFENFYKIKSCQSVFASEKCLLPTKSLQTYCLFKNKLPIIDSWIGYGNAFLKLEMFDFKYPAIVKLSSGSEGKEVFLVKSKEEAIEVFNQFKSEILLVQPFLLNDGDVRVMVLGNKAIWAIARKTESANEYRNNVAQGGATELLTLTDEMENLAVRASEAVYYDLAGVDLIKVRDSNEWKVMEVNWTPSIAAFKSKEPISTDEEMMRMLIEN